MGGRVRPDVASVLPGLVMFLLPQSLITHIPLFGVRRVGFFTLSHLLTEHKVFLASGSERAVLLVKSLSWKANAG